MSDHSGLTRARPTWRSGSTGVPIPSRWSVLVAAIAVTAVWVVAALFRLDRPAPGPVDRWWDGLMSAATDPWTHAVATVMAVIGTGLPGTALAIVLAVLIAAVRGWAWGLLVLVASGLSALHVDAMKTLAMRTRPDPGFGLMNAFPSGHTAYAALLGGVVFLVVRHVVVRSLAIAWFIAMAWSRTALHAHWLTDVVAGIVVGTATAVLLVAAWGAVLRRRDAVTRTRRSSDLADDA